MERSEGSRVYTNEAFEDEGAAGHRPSVFKKAEIMESTDQEAGLDSPPSSLFSLYR